MRDAVIVEAVRTPVGKLNGGLSAVHPVDLSALVSAAYNHGAGQPVNTLVRVVESATGTGALVQVDAALHSDASRKQWMG